METKILPANWETLPTIRPAYVPSCEFNRKHASRTGAAAPVTPKPNDAPAGLGIVGGLLAENVAAVSRPSAVAPYSRRTVTVHLTSGPADMVRTYSAPSGPVSRDIDVSDEALVAAAEARLARSNSEFPGLLITADYHTAAEYVLPTGKPAETPLAETPLPCRNTSSSPLGRSDETASALFGLATKLAYGLAWQLRPYGLNSTCHTEGLALDVDAVAADAIADYYLQAPHGRFDCRETCTGHSVGYYVRRAAGVIRYHRPADASNIPAETAETLPTSAAVSGPEWRPISDLFAAVSETKRGRPTSGTRQERAEFMAELIGNRTLTETEAAAEWYGRFGGNTGFRMAKSRYLANMRKALGQ